MPDGWHSKSRNRLADKPEIQELMAAVPVMATWDNHDYGTHSGGAEFPLKRVSRDIFLDFFDEPAGSARRLREGVYDAKIFGPEGRRVQVILLDTRYFKGTPLRDERSAGEKARLDKNGAGFVSHEIDTTPLVSHKLRRSGFQPRSQVYESRLEAAPTKISVFLSTVNPDLPRRYLPVFARLELSR